MYNKTKSKFYPTFFFQEAAFKLKTYTKFFFVREPFERLLSAYRNKLETYTERNRYFKETYGTAIKRGFKMGDYISFSNYVDYLVRMHKVGKQSQLNEHWAPYHSLCHPCLLQYDFIGRYESLIEDSNQILYHVDAPANLSFPSNRPHNTSGLIPKYFKSLSNRQIKDLLRAYHDDFVLFDYHNNFTQS